MLIVEDAGNVEVKMNQNQERCDRCGRWVIDCSLVLSLKNKEAICDECWKKESIEEKSVKETQYLWQWRDNRADGQLPDEWFAHRILKKTKCFVFVEYKVGENHPSSQTMKLDRLKLESENEIFWSHGTWSVRFYTEEGKKNFDELRLSYRTLSKLPPCLIALGLTTTATKEDVSRAYKELAQKEHPDKGGSHEAFLTLKQNYETAMRMVRE